jgi:4-amino-4-deoxy-L-arabinose transferase-like glycosyltransferase
MTFDLTAPSTRTPTSPLVSPRVARSFMVVFLLGLGAGLAMVFVGFRAQGMVDTSFDPYYFGEMGKSLARGEGFAPFGVLIQRRAPLYPLLIGGIYSLFGEQSIVVLVAQAALLAGTCTLVFDIGRRMFNVRTGIIAGVLCALNPMLLRYVGDLQLETMLTFLVTFTVWSAVRFYGRPTLTGGVLLGVSAGLGSLTKSVAFPYPFVFAAVVLAIGIVRWRRGHKPQVPWAGLAAMFAALFMVIAPWTVRNYLATGGHVVLISSGTSDAFLRGYIFSRPEFALLRQPPYTDAENASNAWFKSIAADAGTEWQRDDYETDQILNRAAIQQLASQPGEFVRKFVVGLFTFWYEMTNLSTSLVAGVLALATLALAIVGVRRAPNDSPTWILILPAVYLNLILAALLALGRYSVPILPPLLVVSAFGLDSLLSRRRTPLD